MGFNQQDANNLNRSKEMFGSIGMETGLPDEMVTLFPIKAAEYPENAADVLRDALMSAMRFDQSMNLWIDVQLPHIPGFVAEAIVDCSGTGLRLVLTHEGASSHAPGEPLSAALVEAIARASESRQVWHPLAKRMVNSIKRQLGEAG